MWVSEKAAERIRELEGLLRDSVSKAVYDSALARIAELDRRIDWQCNMLLRRGDSISLPPLKQTVEEAPAAIEDFESDREKIQAIIEQGKALKLTDQDIAEAVQKTFSGWNEADIAKAINAPNNGHG